jgi:hypothetical protein
MLTSMPVRLAPLLIELIARDRSGDGERADDEVVDVPIHRSGHLFCALDDRVLHREQIDQWCAPISRMTRR